MFIKVIAIYTGMDEKEIVRVGYGVVDLAKMHNRIPLFLSIPIVLKVVPIKI